MSAPRSRTVWRVLADPPGSQADFVESWHRTACEAHLLAQSLEADGYDGIEVNRCVLGPKVSRIALLNRRGFLEDSDIVPPEVWRRPIRRARRGGRS